MLFLPQLFSLTLLTLFPSSTSAYSPPQSTPSVNTTFCPPHPATPLQQKAIFASFVQDFLVKKDFVRTFNTYIADDYIQHNPYALSGRQAVLDFFKNVDPSTANYTILSQGTDGNYAYVHYRSDLPQGVQGEPSAIVDIFRFNGSCIQEHWDVIQQRPVNATNPLALF